MAGYTRGGRILVAVGGRSLSIDRLLPGLVATIVPASDSEGVIVGAMVEAMDMVLLGSLPPLDDMLVVLVFEPGAGMYPPLF
jgi:hypothetical protein